MFHDNSYNFKIVLSLLTYNHNFKIMHKRWNIIPLTYIGLEPKSFHTIKYSQPLELVLFHITTININCHKGFYYPHLLNNYLFSCLNFSGLTGYLSLKVMTTPSRAQNIIVFVVTLNEFYKISRSKSAKDVWDTLEVTHEGILRIHSFYNTSLIFFTIYNLNNWYFLYKNCSKFNKKQVGQNSDEIGVQKFDKFHLLITLF